MLDGGVESDRQSRMRNTLEDWADDPTEFMGVVVGLSLLGLLFSALAVGVLPQFAMTELILLVSVNCMSAAVVATMIVGTVDGQSPGAARVLMPLFCIGSGALLMWIANGRLDATIEVSWGRIGACYLVFGATLLVANIVRRLPRSTVAGWKPD